MSKPFKLAVVQCKGNALDAGRFETLTRLIREAAAKGGQTILLPELVLHDYFCIEENQAHFDLAHTLESDASKSLQALAKELGVTLVFPFFEKRSAGIYQNSAAVFEADGSIAGLYRKMHIPHDPGFNEKYYFTPGDLGFKSIATKHGNLGVLICWDQWFPEGARLTALQGADVLLYPTAIGWDDSESGSVSPDEAKALEARHLDAWITIQRSHAIANGLFVAAANRVGREGHLRFWGNSFIAGPGGEILARMDSETEGVILADVDPARVEAERRTWPFLRDRRIDAYQGMLHRSGN
ncbi:MAG: N-carbamoylputrescine amidase [Fibrobacteria bacterium]|jgi:N-carbamoylputrescine amidase|nr:N-carbamoylputrescine amidase [Fibrobacteria bacterium]